MAGGQGEHVVEVAVAEGVQADPSVEKTGRLQWSLRCDEQTHELQRPMMNAIMYAGIKDVQRLLQNGAPLIAEYPLESEDGPIGTGTTLDLVLLHKRFKLAAQLLCQGSGGLNGKQEIVPEPQVQALTDAASTEDNEPMLAEVEPVQVDPSEIEGSPAAETQCLEELAKASRFGVAWSAREGRAEVLEPLLALGAMPAQHDEHGRSALLLAAMRGHRRCVDLLVAAGAWEQEEAATKEKVCEWLAHFKMVVPASGEGISCDHETPHAMAARLGLIHPEKPEPPPEQAAPERWTNTPHGRIAWPLRSKGRALEEEGLGEGPLERAIVGHGIKEVERVIGLGAPLTGEYRLDAQGNDLGTALDLAMVHRRYNLALQLLTRCEGGDLAQRSTRAVAWAAREGRIDILRELLRLGAPAGQCDESGRSALLLTSSRGHNECAAALLEAGAWQVEGSRDDVSLWASHWKMSAPC